MEKIDILDNLLVVCVFALFVVLTISLFFI